MRSDPVVLIEADSTRSVTKVEWEYAKWAAPIVFTLPDGGKHSTVKRFRLKRDAVAFLATLPAEPVHETTVEFDENGKLYAWVESFWIGGRANSAI
jgi:hypothetical protein